MADIYGQAKAVQVWLASASNFTSDAMRYMALLSLQASSLGVTDNVDQPRFIEESFPLLNISSADAEKLIHDAIEAHVDYLLDQPWFSRVWIVQELTLAKKAVVSCGKSRMTWTNFARALEVVRGAIRQIPYGEERSRVEGVKLAWHLVRTRDIFRYLVENGIRSHHSMATLFGQLMRSNACSDDRDRVYAMLALMQSPYNMKPDYTKTIAEAYTEFTSKYSPHTQLYFAGLCRRRSSYRELKDTVIDQQLPVDISDRDYLPSWVPEFRPSRNHYAWASPFDGHYTTASNLSMWFWSLPGTSNVMYATGTIFDQIKWLTLRYEKKIATECATEAGFYFSLIEQLQETAFNSSEGSHRPAYEPLWLVLIKTITSGVSDCKNAEFILTRYHHFQSLEHLRVGSLAWLTAIWDCFVKHCIEPTGDVYQYVLLTTLGGPKRPFSTEGLIGAGLLNYLANTLVPNRLFTTFDGYFGLAPSITQEGDLIAVLNGCTMPYVMRSAGVVTEKGKEVQGALHVIVPTYLHGIMKGEIAKNRNASPFQHIQWTRREPDPEDTLDGWFALI